MIHTLIQKTIKVLTDPWVIFGLLSQAVFFFRFIVQLIHSEKQKKVVVPLSFWWLSILGTAMILIYSFHIHDVVFILASFLSFAIYFRNVFLHRREHALDTLPE
ncbi:MAG TPA: lipid-A-disaccharide synthase N-terminal domain-containing protein [Candidatus Paceibacterota bacterium]|jgi:lipid-A-disaccharide synthase-like uncharacterized protein|nr:lipid-A-disaccharide synthase N-terminal domain-containing protein [Candidatus Paceibacterota bacterium]